MNKDGPAFFCHADPLLGLTFHHPVPFRPAMLLSGGGAVALLNGPLKDAETHMTVFFVAFLIGTVANLHTRVTASPALIIVVNAIGMLVPDCMALVSR